MESIFQESDESHNYLNNLKSLYQYHKYHDKLLQSDQKMLLTQNKGYEDHKMFLQ
ncbi:hypothetical protein D3C86_1770390 [compost metagenome]